jgi:signal transduction histidine kinase
MYSGPDNCPVLKGKFPCPECFFVEALNALETGLMIGSTNHRNYLFINAYARRLLKDNPDALKLENLLNHQTDYLGKVPLGNPTSTDLFTKQLIRSGARLIGLSVHASSGDRVIITLKDISEDNYFKRPSNSGDMSSIIRIFAQLRHEIGNPLNSIKMSLQVLHQNLDTFPPEKVHAYISRTIGEVRRLEKLLDSMREFSQHNNLNIQELDLRTLMVQVSGLVADEFRNNQMDLEVDVSDSARYVRADSQAIIQLLHNLLRNALQAKKQAAGRVVIRSRADGYQGMVRIEIEDDGRGIPAADLPLVFKPMFTTKPEGSGLGLAFVERIMDRMQGTVSVASEVGHYARFSLTLPKGKK